MLDFTITERKLRRGDSYRAQVPFDIRGYKIVYATVYNFFAEEIPELAYNLRHGPWGQVIIKSLVHDAKVAFKSNPALVRRREEWLRRRCDAGLYDELLRTSNRFLNSNDNTVL